MLDEFLTSQKPRRRPPEEEKEFERPNRGDRRPDKGKELRIEHLLGGDFS